MTWLLVIVLMHADGSVSEARAPGFHTEDACYRFGRAWAAQMARREETLTIDVRCKARTPAASP